MKVWEEEWKARNSVACTDDIYKMTEPRGYIFIANAPDGGDEHLARARLAAQAPAMARLLLAIVSTDSEVPVDMGGPDGTIRQVLRAAGVIEPAGASDGVADDLYINSTGKDY